MFQTTWETIVEESVECVVMSYLTGPSTRLVCMYLELLDEKEEEDSISCLMTAGLGRGRPDSSYDMDDTVFTGGCNTLTILSVKRGTFRVGIPLLNDNDGTSEEIGVVRRTGSSALDTRSLGGHKNGGDSIGT